MTFNFKHFAIAAVTAVALALPATAAVSTAQSKKGLTSLQKEIRHELVMLPWYGVFDHFAFEVDGDKVILSGAVTRPTLASSAANVVARIEGVEQVVNNIEVLPLSPFDDNIRINAYNVIYGNNMLSRYNWGPIPPIHIIVKNGHITLEGVVDNETDKNVATLMANQVPGAFSVTNNLRVAGSR